MRGDFRNEMATTDIYCGTGRVSGALPSSVHDRKAEWIWGVLGELKKAGLVALADKDTPHNGLFCLAD